MKNFVFSYEVISILVVYIHYKILSYRRSASEPEGISIKLIRKYIKLSGMLPKVIIKIKKTNGKANNGLN